LNAWVLRFSSKIIRYSKGIYHIRQLLVNNAG
jgi:hypothetical protein